MELVDVTDSKSVDGDIVWVRVPPPAPKKSLLSLDKSDFFILTIFSKKTECDMKHSYKNYLINLIFPAFIFGSLTGVLTALVVTLYKTCAKYVIQFSEIGYHFLKSHLYFVPIFIALLFGAAYLFTLIYSKNPTLRGGGIPTSIGVLRGIVTFKWLRNLIGVFFLSLSSFLIGVPLGNEGPSVQMGTAIGRGSVFASQKKHRAWDRYSMTGGACAGFSVATGAPISGIMFALEEAHQRISPMIIIVSSTSVMFAYITTEILKSIFNINVALFGELQLISLSIKDIWIPIAVGLAMGIWAVLFLRYYNLINKFFNKKLKKTSAKYKIFFVFLITLLLGLCSYSFISTGHELIIALFDGKTAIYMLVLILIVRSTLTLCANSNGVTGGMFVPILALGAVLSSILGKTMTALFGLGENYYTIILVLGISACISGMMKMPLTAILFALEALSCYENILYVIIVCGITFVVTEIFGAKSINDSVLENRMKDLNDDTALKVIDTFVTVQEDSFAVGKQIRDIFWPANLFVLSLRHETHGAEIDEHGGTTISVGDILHVRYSTTDEENTKAELTAIVGDQNYCENETDII